MTHLTNIIKDWFPNIHPSMIKLVITFVIIFVLAVAFRQKEDDNKDE